MTRDEARARLAVLRARAKARADAYPGPWCDPDADARLSEENAPFMALQAETSAWRGHTCPTACDDDCDDDCDARCHEAQTVRWRRGHDVTDCERKAADEDSAGMPGASRGGWFLCCMGGFRRVLCWLDNVNHELLGSRLRLVCDLHDRTLTGMTLREVRRNGDPQ